MISWFSLLDSKCVWNVFFLLITFLSLFGTITRSAKVTLHPCIDLDRSMVSSSFSVSVIKKFVGQSEWKPSCLKLENDFCQFIFVLCFKIHVYRSIIFEFGHFVSSKNLDSSEKIKLIYLLSALWVYVVHRICVLFHTPCLSLVSIG